MPFGTGTLSHEYDNNKGWVTKVVSCGSCSDAGTTEYVRDDRGNVTAQKSGAASDPWSRFYFDALSRLTKVESPFADLSSTATTSFFYNSWGNRTKVTDSIDKVTSFTERAFAELADDDWEDSERCGMGW